MRDGRLISVTSSRQQEDIMGRSDSMRDALSSRSREHVEMLEPRRLLSAATSGVVEYDPIAGKEYLVPPGQYASVDADLAVLEQSLQSEGYEGLEDFLATLGTPRDFQAKLNAQLGIVDGNNKTDDTCGCAAHSASAEVEGFAGDDNVAQIGGQESVFGNDDRTQITGTTSFPYRTIGRINTGCSGSMIGPYHFLTAVTACTAAGRGARGSPMCRSPSRRTATTGSTEPPTPPGCAPTPHGPTAAIGRGTGH